MVGRTLSEDGHDVRAIDSEPELEKLSDPDLLDLATSEGRILVSANEKRLRASRKKWSGEGKSHPGLVVIQKSIRNEDFRTIIAGVRALLESTTGEEWTNIVADSPRLSIPPPPLQINIEPGGFGNSHHPILNGVAHHETHRVRRRKRSVKV